MHSLQRPNLVLLQRSVNWKRFLATKHVHLLSTPKSSKLHFLAWMKFIWTRNACSGLFPWLCLVRETQKEKSPRLEASCWPIVACFELKYQERHGIIKPQEEFRLLDIFLPFLMAFPSCWIIIHSFPTEVQNFYQYGNTNLFPVFHLENPNKAYPVLKSM